MSGGGRAAGKVMSLNRKLILEAAQVTPDGAGGCGVAVWTALGTLWAQVAPRSAGRSSGEVGAVSATGFTIWVRGAPEGNSSRPVAGQRFVMGSRYLRIDAVTEEEPGGFYLRCTCREEVST